MDNLKFVLSPILNEDCFDKLIVEQDYTNVACLKYALSKSLGFGIILGSVMVKVPQIVKILKNKSSEGITLLSVLLELFALSSNLAYSYIKGFPFSSWGEVSFMVAQTSTIAALVLNFSFGSGLLAFSFLVGYGATLYALVSGLTPLDVLWTMQAANVPVIVASRMIQAWTNFRNGSTGQLSAVTIFMLFFGSSARIFTSFQETGDTTIIIMYTAATICNSILAFQMLYYWNSQSKTKTKSPKKAQQKSKSSSKSNEVTQTSPKGSPKEKSKDSGGKKKKN